MLTKASVSQLRAAAILYAQPVWREAESYLNAELGRTLELMTESTETVVIHRLQGRAKFIREFLDFLRNSQGVLEKAERPSGGTRG